MRVLAGPTSLEVLDDIFVIENARPDLEKPRPLPEPPPLLQRARRHVPPRRQLILRELCHDPAPCLTTGRWVAIRFVLQRCASMRRTSVDALLKGVTDNSLSY